MITSPLLAYVAILFFCVLKASSLDTFIAAVYEHAVILPDAPLTPVSHEEALMLMNRNLDLLEGAVTSAAKQVQFLESDGTKFSFFQQLLKSFQIFFNNPLLIDIYIFGHTPVQKRLSCLARDNSIYIVANIGDKKPCNASDPDCPHDGRYQYNTDVVFDSEGRLVARYHKQNLFLGEDQFDAPKEPEIVTFDTTFGRFGIFTCFDILFHDPAVTLVKDFQVDTILFPTAWMNVLPHLTAIEFHSAWAMGMRVNFLAANIHFPLRKMTGSGIYAPDSPRAFHYDMKTKEGKLLLSQLDSHPHRPAVNWTSYASGLPAPLVGNQEFKSIVFFDEFTFLELKGVAGNYTVCQKDLCCQLSYRMLEKREDEVYALGAFDGLHTVEGSYYLQVMIVLVAKIHRGRTLSYLSFLRFRLYSIRGGFLLEGVSSDGRLFSLKPPSGPVLTVTLFGRLYERDSASGASADLVAQGLRVMLGVIITIMYSLSW
uniref:Pantetheinase n=1 Tax=Sus scrofa TaxID=9823 RepID=A0A8D1WTB0_PIG